MQAREVTMKAMRGIGLAVLAGWVGMSSVAAVEKSIDELPKDVRDAAFVWTEPLKSVAEHTRQFDPVSGLWFGLLDGTVKSVERTVRIFVPREGGETPEPSKQFKYNF
jgi:hypothetical protein